MLEYVFFDPRPRDRFVEFVDGLGVAVQQENDDDLLKVLVSEDLDEDLTDRIEDYYDEMMALNQSLYEQEGDSDEVGYHAAGISGQLSDGNSVYAQVDPNLLGRIMQVLSPTEFNDVVNAIVEAVENPDSRSMCQRIRDDQQAAE
jgi:Trp operon repressor